MISGIFTALLTPFDKNDRINYKELEKLVDFNLDNGVDGFYVGGSTGEAFMMSSDERKEIFDIVAGKAKGKCSLIAHVGCIDTKETLKLGFYAKEKGYGIISAVTPFYYNFSNREIIDHYLKIVEEVELPSLIYNIPDYSGIRLSFDDISTCLQNRKIIGLKHTSNNYFMLERIKQLYPDKIIFNGYDEMFMAGIAMGADGGIGSTYNFMADKFVSIRKYMMQGEMEKARDIQHNVNDIIALLLRIGVLAGEKEILNNLGFDFGNPRLPFAPLNAEAKKIVKEQIMPYLHK